MREKKLLLWSQTFLITIISVLECQAQDKFSMGISSQMQNTRFMINLANPQTKGAYRPTTYVFAEYNFGRKYAVHTGLGYIMMTQNSDAFKNNFHYLVMPIYFKIGRIKGDKRFAFTSFYGTNLHYLLKAQHIFLDETEKNIMDECRKFHFDLTFGAGIKCKLTDRYMLEVMSSFALGYMVNKYNAAYTDVLNTNTGFILNLSYKFK